MPILLESGDTLLLESGDALLLEGETPDEGGGEPAGAVVLGEPGSHLRMERGSVVVTEWYVQNVHYEGGAAITGSTGVSVTVTTDTGGAVGTYRLAPDGVGRYAYRAVTHAAVESRGVAVYRITSPSTRTWTRACPLR